MPETSLDELAHQLDTPPERIAELIERTCAALPYDHYYVFRAGSADRGTPSGPGRPRTIAAFPTPDDALAFAQRNGYAISAQLKSIPARELIKLLLGDADIGEIRFLQPVSGDESMPGSLPGMTITRQSLLDQLALGQTDAGDLTARAYDALQFGIDFRRRGAFRAALAEAVEHVVARYIPPPGSLDTGRRSIYATGAVEEWLRRNGFAHAAQRRWVDVADQPGWNGADELYEIDCGTQQRLFVQLLIYTEGERQYIGRVVVTS